MSLQSLERQLGLARDPSLIDYSCPKRIVRSVDRRVYDHLKQAIEDLGAESSFMRAPVRQAKDEARAALAEFQQESLSPALREASIILGERLEDVQIHEPALNWEPLLDAWKDVEREAGSEAWDSSRLPFVDPHDQSGNEAWTPLTPYHLPAHSCRTLRRLKRRPYPAAGTGPSRRPSTLPAGSLNEAPRTGPNWARDVRSRMTASMSSTSKCKTVWPPAGGWPRRSVSCDPLPAPNQQPAGVTSIMERSAGTRWARPVSVGLDANPGRGREYVRALKSPSQSSQRTRTRCPTPGSGMDAASTSTASRSARESRRHDSDRDLGLRPSPRPGDLALHEHGAGPYARGPELRDDGRGRGPGAPDRLPAGGSRRPRSGAAGGGRGPPAARNVGSSPVRIHPSPTGVRTGVSDPPSASNAARPAAAGRIPAHWANASGVAGPNTCRYRRASSRRASRGLTSGRGTVQMVGRRAPPSGSAPCRSARRT